MAQVKHFDLETLLESGLEQVPKEEQEEDLPVVIFFGAISFKFVILALILSCPLLLTPNFPSVESLPYCFVSISPSILIVTTGVLLVILS